MSSKYKKSPWKVKLILPTKHYCLYYTLLLNFAIYKWYKQLLKIKKSQVKYGKQQTNFSFLK